MPKAKVSAAEKRERLLSFFHTTKQVWTSKDIQKTAAKQTGIASMIILDVLKELTDDSLVDTDKIGSANYYWAFPAKGLQIKKNKLKQLEGDIEEASSRKRKLTESVAELEKGREPSASRTSGLENLKRLRSEKEHLSKELSALKEVDPVAIAKREEQIKVAHLAANRWTDNVFAARDWCLNKLSGSCTEEQFNKQFGIPNDLDYV